MKTKSTSLRFLPGIVRNCKRVVEKRIISRTQYFVNVELTE